MSRHHLLTGSALVLLLGGCAAATTTSNGYDFPTPPVIMPADPLPSPAQLAPAMPAAIGDTVSGELVEGDSRSDEDGLFDRYVLNLAAGTRVEAVMRSDAFDTYLIVGRDGPDGFQVIGRDDDGLGEGLNSRLRFNVAEPGLYEVRARGFAGGGNGAYTLSFADRGPAPYVPPPGSIAPATW